ncbi:hypothetical protein R6Q59_012016 [Mikania micrantha]
MIVSPAGHFDDLIWNLGGAEKVDPPMRKAGRSERGLDDLLPDFGNDGRNLHIQATYVLFYTKANRNTSVNHPSTGSDQMDQWSCWESYGRGDGNHMCLHSFIPFKAAMLGMPLLTLSASAPGLMATFFSIDFYNAIDGQTVVSLKPLPGYELSLCGPLIGQIFLLFYCGIFQQTILGVRLHFRNLLLELMEICVWL